jgi:uncharacterized protein (TIGR02001 family)
MKRLITSAGLAAVAATLFAPTMALAQDAAPAAAPADPLSFNVGLVTEYRYRGISQSNFKPALQGGADYAFSNGFYLGTWISTIKWIKNWGAAYNVNVGSSPVEWDFYGGYKGEVVKDLTYDVGVLSYYYPTNKLGDVPDSANANTTEIYGALSYSIFTVKYSHAITNLFGFAKSKNSNYIEAVANFDLGDGFSLAPHIGRQRVAGTTPGGVNNGNFTYTDYSLTGAKDFGGGWVATLAVVGTVTKTIGGVRAYAQPNDLSKNLGKTTVVLGGKYTF